ncbi:MAG: hypothetical protein ABW278_10850 [Steroidobacteraceae bacterium]
MMRASALRTALLALGVLVLASGCRSLTANCSKPGAYDSAEELPSLRMPAGLDGPDTRQSMQIPALTEPEAPRTKADGCLEAPPAYTGPHTVTPPGSLAPAGPDRKGGRKGSAPKAPRRG